jgi:hypothetical protein
MLKRGAIAFEVSGRVFSILVLGYAILFRGSSPLLFLWGLWMEEVLSLIGLSVRKAYAHRGGGAERSTSPLALYFAFPAVHLVFVLFFSMVGATGMFSSSEVALMQLPRPAEIASLAAAFAVWTLVDLGRAILLAPIFLALGFQRSASYHELQGILESLLDEEITDYLGFKKYNYVLH